MVIRLATMEDIDTFNKMYVNFIDSKCKGHKLEPMMKKSYQKFIKQESIYFGIIDGNVIGYAIVEGYDNDSAEIRQLYLKEKHKGYGTKFYQLIEAEIQSYNFNIVYIWALWDEAKMFWTQMGFQSIKGGDKFYKKLN